VTSQIESQIFNFRFKLDTFCLLIFSQHQKQRDNVHSANTVGQLFRIELHAK